MNILFITTLSHTPSGGSEVLWINMAIHAQKSHHTVAALVPKWQTKPTHYKRLEEQGIELLFRVGISKLGKICGRLIKRFSTEPLPKGLVHFNPDVVVISQGHTFDLAYSQQTCIFNWLLKLKKPYAIICQNGTDYNYVPEVNIRQRTKKAFALAKQVFFVSERNQRTATHILQHHFSNFKVVSNSISLQKNEIGIVDYPPSEIINFAVVANLKCSHKGQNLVFDILSQPGWLERNWILNLYGKGEDEVYLKELAQFLGISDRVVFHGHVSHIQGIWEINHIMLLASFGEGLPLALQEAMLCGRTAVVTDVGGNSELINNHTGYLAEGTTFIAFDKAMEKAWCEKQKWPELGMQAYQFALSKIDLNPEKILLEILTN